MTRTNFVERLCATVEKLPDLKGIIIDPVSRFRGGNENQAEDATRFVEAAELITKETGATVLLLHHTNKASTQASEQNQGASRGSSALTDGVRLQINLAPLTPQQAQDLGLEDDAKYGYITAKVTKSNYAPMGGTVYLRRGEHGVLTYYAPQEAQRAAQGDRIELLVQLVRDASAKGAAFSKTALAKFLGGGEGPFNIGINKVDQLIERAITEGFLARAPGHARHLVPTGKAAEIGKAKVVLPAMSMEAHKGAHGPEKGEESKT